MGFYEDFLTGLERAARERFKNPAKMAENLGVEPNLITRWLNKDRVPKAERMGEVLDALGAKLIFPDKNATHPREAYLATVAEEMRGKGLTILPVHAAAGAGTPSEDEEVEPKFHIAVPRQYVRPQLDTLLIEGDSMEPIILDKAVVGVNRESADIVQGRIYAVRLPYEGVVVKRLFLDHENRQFILRSDNKEYRDVKIAFEEGDNFICGQVVWVLQSYEKIVI